MKTRQDNFDVIVVGSGHAGVEAALVAARRGCRTLMLTQNLDTIAHMSCNPAIGGTGKGHLVREIDALGGAMGVNADLTGIHFRQLNSSKGPSVRSPRIQCDKAAYRQRLKAVVETQSDLEVKQVNVSQVLVNKGAVIGVKSDLGVTFTSSAVVVTAGTFLGALVHVGSASRPGGRMSEANSNLSTSLCALGFESLRFKTGTPCRVSGRSIDFGKCDEQPGDLNIPRFSFTLPPSTLTVPSLNLRDGAFHVEQMSCWATHTTAKTHDLVKKNLHLSALHAGAITGVGPRHCPSIEDKIRMFCDKESHNVFLEPEGRSTVEYYINGVSTSLPYEVQVAFIRTIPGLERAELMRAGYAVEYDVFPATQLKPTLETKRVENLFFAGQINGTSGYEEAAAQGLIAGLNAALGVANQRQIVLPRSSSYIGILIDDIVNTRLQEPYRIFTSRAEHRLTLRADTADQRLTPLGRSVGVVSDDRWCAFQRKIDRLSRLRSSVAGLRGETTARGDLPDESTATGNLLKCDVSDQELKSLISSEAVYSGYVRHEFGRAKRFMENVDKKIPEGFDLSRIPSLSAEGRDKLRRLQPQSLRKAAISGIKPADLLTLHSWLAAR